MPGILRDYQKKAARFAVNTPNPFLFMPLGSGKTLTSLALIRHYRQPTLVVGPLNVVKFVWPDEIERWLPESSWGLIHGTPRQRDHAVESHTLISLINYENLVWLIENHEWRWPLVVFDESSKLKSNSKRVKAFKKIRPKVRKVIMLSGTPAVNNPEALFFQFLCLDGGETFGKYITHFRNRYMVNHGRNFPDWRLRPGALDKIYERASKNMFTLSPSEVSAEMPDSQVIDIRFDIDFKHYKQMEKELMLTLDGTDILAPSAATKSLKLRQLCSGFVYSDNDTYQISDEKLEAFNNLMEEIGDEQVLVFYQFKAEADTLDLPKLDVEAWNSKKITRMMLHPASAGHGLNLQLSSARYIIFFSIPWDAEQYLQAIGRLLRPGNNSEKVVVYRLIAGKTIEERVCKVLNQRVEEHQGRMLCEKSSH